MPTTSSRADTFLLGRVSVAVAGSSAAPIPDLFRNILDVTPQELRQPAALRFRLVTDLSQERGDGAPPVGIGRCLRFNIHQQRSELQSSVEISLPTAYRLTPDAVLRMLHPGRHSAGTHAAQLFCDGLFDPLCHVAGLGLGQSLIHTGAVVRDGRCTLLLGSGGMGKTGTVLRLVRDHDWLYLSDDLTVITDDGSLYLSHHQPQVSPRNFLGSPHLESEFLAGLNTVDRAAWKLHGALRQGRGLRRKALARTLMGGSEKLASTAPVTQVLYLHKCETSRIVERTCTVAQAAGAAAEGMDRELRASLPSVLPFLRDEPESLVEQRLDILRNALSAAECTEVQVPLALPEHELESYLVARLA